jgi:MYXO-CTERM domain-containing protein
MGEEGEEGLFGLLVFAGMVLLRKRRLTDFLVGVGKPQLSFEW